MPCGCYSVGGRLDSCPEHGKPPPDDTVRLNWLEIQARLANETIAERLGEGMKSGMSLRDIIDKLMAESP